MLAPLAALGVLGWWVARGQEARAASEVHALLERKLEAVAGSLEEVTAGLERDLLAATDRLPTDPDELRALGRRRVRLRGLLVVGPGARLRFPPPDQPTSEDEQRLVRETGHLWRRGGPLARDAPDQEGGQAADHGWQALPGEDGAGLLFWRRERGLLVAVAVSGADLLAALLERLPATEPSPLPGGDERIALHDPAGRLAYQWGAFRPRPGAVPLVAVPLHPPLAAWRVGYLGPAPSPGRATLGIAAGLAALAAVVLGAGFWVHRESTRELRLAARRVSFVNQVSHELKTPLTSVRLYAELLEDHLDPDDEVGRQRLGVVVAEGQRLGRLIDNVLTLSRAEKSGLRLHPAPGSVDEVIEEALAQFEPGFAARAVTAHFRSGAPGRVKVDGDALRQILGNLFSNVEKYAAPGEVEIHSAQTPASTSISVHDRGPGVPAEERERVFEPFVRLGAAVHEGVPGTGIGLGIARDLARLHGGDLRVVPAEHGARFELTLRTEPCS